MSALLEGPRFEPPEFAALYGAGTVLVASLGSGAVVADGRPWKYLSLVNSLADQLGADDLAVALDQAPLRLAGKDHLGNAGHRQRIDQSGDEREREENDDGRTDFAQHDSFSSGEMQGGDGEVDRLDADERDDHAAAAIDPEIAPQQRAGADRAIAHAFQRQRNERDDDQRVEDDRRENGALLASPAA